MIKVNDDLEREVYEAIGRFIFWFSKLEGMMKADLAGMLDLDNDYLDPVTSAFDFAQLCKVLAAMRRKGSAPDDQKKVDEFYNEVFKLNDRRNQVAHGDWTLSGARVVSRHTRTATIHFDKLGDLNKLSDRCMTLAVQYYRFLPEHRYKQQTRDVGED
ncbi:MULTISPECIES: hypothetical protein [Bradyrhizobium]|jgi:hypothetical protein|uniref:hypothetical protein n=1 Tax=Bradyrhizobium TaxID=374 RepID=UPI00048377F6|nr:MULTISPECIES: hypothetical protein [Bradyrhizobium]MCS3451524.1 hypothetical protein [Bradyrhizobium elkanii]MCS3566377.1 hypothetical protein [Bradyrhizobium elkanii]MCW2152894.1 hypothetical protein [Bradyrhizobium elkanii]MCW2357372.1 hypothetical protein [Bradyrhizobium elkanii]MCW2376626.1 hypothetical protein [Bradyrhizobium elkanii]